MSNQFSLLGKRRFLPFFLTQFLGAFNDNVFKQAIVIFLTFSGADLVDLPLPVLTNLCAGLFILPFFLFSATAGQIADKYEKASLIRLTKQMEVAIMVLGAAGLLLQEFWILMLALFLMGTQSTLFGPIKYSILPQSLHKDELIGGNGLVEMATSVAILTGSILGGWLVAQHGGRELVAWAVLGIAVAGYIASRQIPAVSVTDPTLRINWNPVTETWRTFQFTRHNRTVFLSILGISWFWFYGATFLAQMPVFAKDVLGGNEMVVILMLTIFSVGVGIGSLLCEKLSGKRVELGLVPFGSIGITGFAVDLYFATRGMQPAALVGVKDFLAIAANQRVVFDLLMIGLFAGFYIVPLYALVQTRTEPDHRARVIAGNNILNAFFMVVSALMAVGLLTKAGFSIPDLFLTVATLSALISLYIYTLVPEFLMRFLVWIFMSMFYRVETKSTDRIPEEGPAVMVCNHVSFFDALILATAIRRPPRFVMDHNIFRNPVLNFIFRTARAIPIAPAKVDAALLEKAYDDIAEALENGELVCIFPEGRITDNGEMYPFKNGIQRIVERTPVPVYPIALQGLWGSFSSRKGGPAFTKFPRRFRSHVAVSVGAPVPPDAATPEHLEARVRELRGDWK